MLVRGIAQIRLRPQSYEGTYGASQYFAIPSDYRIAASGYFRGAVRLIWRNDGDDGFELTLGDAEFELHPFPILPE